MGGAVGVAAGLVCAAGIETGFDGAAKVVAGDVVGGVGTAGLGPTDVGLGDGPGGVGREGVFEVGRIAGCTAGRREEV